ncbi:pseudouridine synthase [Flaviaesturariibacter flavus]|uniref:Pseudouridine synthase n=1 Tax=Flaviaesturariibacter flavus TaxID=2502780 RepID=A0A4R1B5D6_9BACT|nr:pseudouridine synthase [Flaviaesturariibacter flavus]TCJ13344.1 pseudouridine synthase [Flaviaesturariibacter flavus]
MNKKSGFEKFHKGGPKKGAALKEQFRQEKKEETRKRKAFFEQQRADKAAARNSGFGSEAPAPRGARTPKAGNDRPAKPAREEGRPSKFSKEEPRGARPAARPAKGPGKEPAAPKRTGTPNDKDAPKGSFRVRRAIGDTAHEARPTAAPDAAPDRKPVTRARKEAQMPLNKYLAHGGICSRREAADVVKSGKVQVNGAVVTEPGYKVQADDKVTFNGKKVTPTGNLVYILLNKPKDYLTTTDDPQQRKTVLDLIARATEERVYPVGRLDRNTSGVLLLTNDGELAQTLTHPSNEVRKVYAVTLDKPLTKAHFDEILKGVPLEDGLATVDSLAYADSSNKKEVGIEIHSGRNRIVRRIFEHFGYDVKGLDRVIFAGLTKKNVPRGKWRLLSEKEVRDLKFFKKGKK